MRMRLPSAALSFRLAPVALLVVACARPAPVTQQPSPAPVTTASVASVPSATPPPASAPDATAEVYVGAVGALPVRATIARTASRLTGRWVYEGRGSAEGLLLEGPAATGQGAYAVREATVSGKPTGAVWLSASGTKLDGTWQRLDGTGSLPVILRRELRAREGENVVRARRVMAKRKAGEPGNVAVAFLPVVDGPAAARMNPHLTLKALTEDEEGDLGDGITEVSFDVVHHDARVLTITTAVYTMGAYPSAHGSTVTLSWSTGRKLGADVLRPEKRNDLVALLDRRVHEAWNAKKRELAKGPTAESDCGPGVIDGFMRGDGPSFTPDMLETIYVDAEGIGFTFDFDFAHVVRACSPEVDLRLPWSEAQAFVARSSGLRP